MQKVLALVLLVGSVSAGQTGYSYDTGYSGARSLNGARSGLIGDLAAIDRNSFILAVGAHNGAVRDSAAIQDAINTVIAGARAAAIRDQLALQRASATLDIINADGAARNAAAQAAINDYATLRNAAIQSQQLALARISNRGFLGYSAPALVSRGNAGIPIGLSAGRAGNFAFGYGGQGNFGYGFGTGAVAQQGSRSSSRPSRRNN